MAVVERVTKEKMDAVERATLKIGVAKQLRRYCSAWADQL